MRGAQTTAAVALVAAYFFHVFQMAAPAFREAGIGDWGDPNFINYLLEHWYYSVARLTDPASPPMYFPVRGTLGYSHGLILYAPVYVGLRTVLDPLHAHSATILLVLVGGTVCLYFLLRHVIRVTFIEAVLLTAFFASSRNVINAATSIWSQTASVFLIPPILVLLAAATRTGRAAQTALAGAAGLAATLLFTQEFYTAQFSLFFALAMIGAWLLIGADPTLLESAARLWREERRRDVRAAAIVCAIAIVWAIGLVLSGGGVVEVLGVRLASRDWRRPAALALAALAVLMLRRRVRPTLAVLQRYPWLTPFAAGAAAGCVVFLWIYLPSYLQHGGFSSEQLMSSLVPHDPQRWRELDPIHALGVYDSVRPFRLAFLVGALVCIPWLAFERKTRRYAALFLLLSLIVLVAPVRFGTFSFWKSFVAPFPGFSAIRDPKRIIHVYELLLVLVCGVFLAQLRTRRWFRGFVAGLIVVLILTDWNPEVFVFARPTAEFRRWVEAPVQVAPECESFFVAPASHAYTSRWNNPWILYSGDAMFIALRRGLPTLNGYSAWFPEDWRLFHPPDAGYSASVERWVEKHHLTGVCELDIEHRTMNLRARPSMQMP